MASCNNRSMHRHVNSLFLQPHGNRFLVATCVIPPPRLRDAELFRETRPTGCRRRLDVPVDAVILLGFDHRERKISENALGDTVGRYSGCAISLKLQTTRRAPVTDVNPCTSDSRHWMQRRKRCPLSDGIAVSLPRRDSCMRKTRRFSFRKKGASE